MSESRDLTAYYQLEQVLGWSGTARTFRGQDPESGEPVAVKLISLGRVPGAETLLQRFETTVGVLRSLSHPSLPEILDHGSTPAGDAYMVSTWIEGEVLASEGPVPPAVLLPVVTQLIEALESLSLHGLVHLNLKPENVLVEAGGRARLLGWGSSLLTVDWQSRAARPVDSTASDFGAPELRLEASSSDALWRADAYSVALLTARLLGAEIENAGEAKPHLRFTKELSEQLQSAEVLRQMLQRCLHGRPERRPNSYTEILRALQHAMPRDAHVLPQETQPLGRSMGGDPDATLLASPGDLPKVSTPAAAPLAAAGGVGGGSSGAPLEGFASSMAEAPTQVVLRDLLSDVLDDPEPEDDPASGPEAGSGEEVKDVRDTVPQDVLTMEETVAVRRSASEQESVSVRGSETTEVVPLSALPPPPIEPKVPPASTPAAAESKPSPSKAPRTPPSTETSTPRQRVDLRPYLLAAAGLVALVLVAWLVLALVRGRSEPEASEPFVDGLSLPPTDESILDLPDAAPVNLPLDLVRALEHVAEGEWLEARDALEGLAELDEEGFLPSVVCAPFRATQEVVSLARRDQLLEQLADGLSRARLPILRRALNRMSQKEETLVRAADGGPRLINKARAWRRGADELERELKEGTGIPALEIANRLDSELPELARSLDARNRAVESVDENVEMLMAADRLEEARSILGDLDRLWPSRPSTARRLQQIELRLDSKERYETLLTRIEELGQRGRPHEGLAMLLQIEPPAEFAPRFAQLRETLRLQFQDLDRGAPSVRLLDPIQEIEYRKGQPITIELIASDDYQVGGVRVQARLGDQSAVRDLVVEQLGSGRYRVEISPSAHEDKPVGFWVQVDDLSGHVGRLGSSEQPIELKRRRWFRRGGS